MLSFSYTLDLQLRDTLHEIDRQRALILSLALPIKTEYKLQWEAMAIKIWATLSMANYDMPKQYVAAILGHPTKPSHSVALIQSIKQAYDFIHTTWRANPKSIPVSAIETIYTTIYPRLHDFSSHEMSIKELLTYLDSANEHPLIQASLAHIHMITLPELKDPGILARLTHYLILAKYGYDVRGYLTPERQWQNDQTYTHFANGYQKEQTSTKWLSFMTNSMYDTLVTLKSDIETSKLHVEFPSSFWELSDRQRDILKLIENPTEKITNRQVQRRFKVSQITASRDLTRLTSLGLMYPHGKGRSVFYTKI